MNLDPTASHPEIDALPRWSSRFQRTAAKFCRALKPSEVAETLLEAGLEIPTAYAGIVVLKAPGQDELRTVALTGYGPALAEKLARLSSSARLPVVDAALKGEPVILRDPAELRAAYPDCDDLGQSSPPQAIVALPLDLDGRGIGSVALSFSRPRAFAPEELDPLRTLAAFAAQALDRAELYERTERALRDREAALDMHRVISERYETALDSAGMAVWETDLRTGHVYRSELHDRLYGHSIPLPEWTYERFLQALHEDDREAVRLGVQRMVEEQRDRYDTSFRIRWADGSVHWVSSRSLLVRDARGVPVAIRGAIINIDQLKNAEAELQSAVRIRDEFLSLASHELKTPLTSLMLQVQILERELNRAPSEAPKPPGPPRNRIEAINRQLTRLNSLIERLLDVSRIQRGVLPLELEEIDLSACVREWALRFLEESAQGKLPFTFEIREGIVVSADRGRLEQVVQNLLSNAARHASGSEVHLSLVRDDERDEAVLEVWDRGPGIPLELQERIFHRFEQAEASRSSGGLGLGLYVSQQIVEAHGGRITAANEPARGARFTVRLKIRGRSPAPRDGSPGNTP